MTHPPLFFSALLLAALAPSAAWSQSALDLPEGARMSYLDNGTVKVGVDLNRGGAIAYFARAGGANLINNYDRGRQAQLSFYSGPVPFAAGGRKPAKHWEHLGWNPVQAGDDFGHAPQILAHDNDGRVIHLECRPLQWPLDGVPADCVFATWLELAGPAVKVRARLENARADRTPYPARLQELPAVYACAAYHRVVSYTGARPFAGGAITEIGPPPPGTRHPWSFWIGTEGWAAALDANDRGLGLVTPGRAQFTGGLAGQPGSGGTRASATAYLAGQASEILDHDIRYEYRFELVAGSLDEIRARAAAHRPRGLPAWTFATDRQGWHYQNASDRGWPVAGQIEIGLGGADPQAIGPHVFWRAEDAPGIVIEAAFHTAHRTATVFWQPFGQEAPRPEDKADFPIVGDGIFRAYTVPLAGQPTYRGAMIRLRFDPTPGGEPDGWVNIRSIRLAAAPGG